MAKHGLTKYDQLTRIHCDHMGAPLPQTFGRIARHNPVSGTAPDGHPFDAKRVTEAVTEALDAMEDTEDRDSDVAAGMTFLGQFIDHDVTLDASSAIGTAIDPRTIRNIRTPGLDLDCVYGDGPEASPHLYSPEHHGYLLFGTKDNPLDLARTCKGTALIGDPRNDENQIVSQVQGAFVALHNILVAKFEKDRAMQGRAFAGVSAKAMRESVVAGLEPFEAARRVCRLHYHWIILNEFLPAFVDAKVLHAVKDALAEGRLPKPFGPHAPIMPIEFSGAAYRFGHATVQNRYTLNATVGEVGLFDDGVMGFGPKLTAHNIRFAHLFDTPGEIAADRARPIGRKLPASIFSLPFVGSGLVIDGHDIPPADAKKLPLRNVLRDRFALELASGQQVARAMHVDPIPAPEELTRHGITKTPLWYYCLHEAEHFGGKLGPVGGTIVATVLIRLMHLGPESLVCSAPDFEPWAELGAEPNGAFSMGHLMRFVEENRDHVEIAAHLRCPD